MDVDIVVPNVQLAVEKLSMNGFKANPGPKMTVTDRPMPTKVSDEPQILTLSDLISVKLSSYIGNGDARLWDAADVGRLIQVNRLPRDYAVHAKVQDEYHRLWDSIHKERLT